jgi:hypothetical protein
MKIMTTEEKELANEYAKSIIRNVDKRASNDKNSNSSDDILADSDDSRIRIQYITSLNDPRRI